MELSRDEYNISKHNSLPWIEKYRPRRLDSVMLNDDLRYKLTNFIENKNIPNLILTGPPGVGKTTTIRCLAFELFGKYYKDSVLELNASDDRGIKSVQGEIINFCKIIRKYKNNDDKIYCKHKLVILDEADNIMEKAQHQINVLMEQYNNTIKFVFTCNSSSDIIEAIQSRSVIIRYMRMEMPLIKHRLKQICEIEKIVHDDKSLILITELSRGDLRGAINILQLIFNKYKEITKYNVNNVCDMPQIIVIKNMLDLCIKKDLKKAFQLMYKLKNDGFAGSDITLGMFQTLKSEICKDIPEDIKFKLLDKICMTTYEISKYTDSMLLLASCIAELANI